MQFDFFRGNETEQYMFYRVPQILFTDEKFKGIACESKLLYGFLLDRTSLSLKNNWLDKNGNVYVYFTQEEAMEKLNIGKDKAIKIFAELEKIGLIIRKKQGQGNPTKIFVMNFAKQLSDNSKAQTQTSEKSKSEKKQTEVKTSKKPKSKHLKKRGVEVAKSDPIHTDINHTDISHTNQSIYQAEAEPKPMSKSELKSSDDGQTDLMESITEDIKLQIEYDTCLKRLDELGITADILDLVVDILLEPYISDSKITINGISLSSHAIRTQFKKISFEHIQYVFDSMRTTAQNKKIKNLRSYLRTCLYNAPHTIDQHYANEVDYDFNN